MAGKDYWEKRALGIHAQYGHDTSDYRSVVGAAIEAFDRNDSRPLRILDFGCGSGRLIPVYFDLAGEGVIEHATLYDISLTALNLAVKRAEGVGAMDICSFISDPDCLRRAGRYDLIVSARALSAVEPQDISATMKELSSLADMIYLDEMVPSEYPGYDGGYWYLHDFPAIMKELGFTVIDGTSGRLYGRELVGVDPEDEYAEAEEADEWADEGSVEDCIDRLDDEWYNEPSENEWEDEDADWGRSYQ